MTDKPNPQTFEEDHVCFQDGRACARSACIAWHICRDAEPPLRRMLGHSTTAHYDAMSDAISTSIDRARETGFKAGAASRDHACSPDCHAVCAAELAKKNEEIEQLKETLRVIVCERDAAFAKLERLNGERNLPIHDCGTTFASHDICGALRERLNSDGEGCYDPFDLEARDSLLFQRNLWRDRAKKAEAENERLLLVEQSSGDLCEDCGWNGKRGGPCEFCRCHQLQSTLDRIRKDEWIEQTARRLQGVTTWAKRFAVIREELEREIG